jgi:hypothetical protein
VKYSTLLLLLAGLSFNVLQAQDTLQISQDTLRKPWVSVHQFTATNNGVSIVPAFSLGRPAYVWVGKMGNEKWTLEPEIRTSYDLEPWSAVVWARYAHQTASGWRYQGGMHYALIFRAVEEEVDGSTLRTYSATRNVGTQFTAFKSLGNGYGVSAFALAAKGVYKGAPESLVQLHSIMLTTPKMNVGKVEIGLTPQMYYLNVFGPQGVFYAGYYNISKQGSPWAITGLFTQPFWKEESLVVAPVVWNIGLTYSMKNTHEKIVPLLNSSL